VRGWPPAKVAALAVALAVALGVALAAPHAAGAAEQRYVLDPAHSRVHFEVLHFGTSTVRGRFGPVDGEVMIDPAAGRGELSLRIATADVDTGIGFFNARLKEDDLLAVGAWPEAYFVATRFRFEGPRLVEVRGEFTFRGTSQPLSLQAQRYACRPDGDSEVCGGDFEASFKRSEFGATFGLPFIADLVRLQVQVEGRRR
jgi:polyisoprenoid-binding protein YceI